MNKKLIFIVVILLQVIGFQVQAQWDNLAYSKQVLIGPENVNIHYEEQAEYYIQKYESHLPKVEEIKTQIEQQKIKPEKVEIKTEAEKDAEDIREVIELRKQKGKKTKFLEKMLSHAEEAVEKEKEIEKQKEAENQIRRQKQIERQKQEQKRKQKALTKEMELTKEYIKLWSDYKMAESKDLSDLSSENTCYEIIGENDTYAPGEYKVLEININEQLQWDELVKEIQTVTYTKQVVIEEASSVKKQVKKPDCESPNPDDCLEWKEVAIPAKYGSMTATERMTKRECQRGFEYQDMYDSCVKTITINSAKNHIKIINVFTGMEIKVIDYKQVKCE